jgi:chorismate mutase
MDTSLVSWIKNTPRPFVIAGPCSIETEERTHQVISDLKSEGKTQLLRAGIWKPRTRPDSFEGIGEVGLPWLAEAAKKHELPFSIEVANSKHVELALKNGADVLWVGARTTVNPFAVQEIADSLRGTNIPVMIKNPINPDLNLWIGAFERLQHAGITDLVAIHRGFSVYKHDTYRNVPTWEIPIALKQELTDIPLICDPSHIAGRTDLLQEVSQKAMDLNYNGLMIETHTNPEVAWSDAKQQITAKSLTELLSVLVLRSNMMEQRSFEELDAFRKQVNALDGELFDILVKRMNISEEIGRFKKEHNITILQEEHWKKIVDARLQMANDLNLTNDFVRSILDAIHLESITRQISVMNK